MTMKHFMTFSLQWLVVVALFPILNLWLKIAVFFVVDECASTPCVNGGSCVDGINQYTCTCASGWEGILCDVGKSGFVMIIYDIIYVHC